MDVPASRIEVQCVTCDGDGIVIVLRAAVIGGQLGSMPKPEVCPTCSESAPGERSGWVNLATGPGARLRRVDRVRLPGDW